MIMLAALEVAGFVYLGAGVVLCRAGGFALLAGIPFLVSGAVLVFAAGGCIVDEVRR